jgi:regulator of sirC expression with transglutaminase-like and TPR domain
VTFDANALLIECGTKKDSAINLCECALAMAALSHVGISIERYIHHVEKLTRDVKARYAALLEGGAEDNAATHLASLKHILSDQEGYEGDEDTYDDLQNADLMRVIDRRKGLPIALGILYIQVGRNAGFQIEGLNFPGHFLCRVEQGSQRVIFDPFMRCEVLEAPELRQLIKRIKGLNAELLAEYYQAASNREILIRLQNNIKLRLIEAADYSAALEAVEMMRLIDPGEYRLLFDAGVLYAKTGQNGPARKVLEAYLDRVTDYYERRDAEDILNQIKLTTRD